MELTEKFLRDRVNLISKYEKWGNIDIDGKLITLHKPELLAAFAGYLKFQNRNSGSKIFYRGEKNFHINTLPSLFRFDGVDFNNSNIQNRVNAYTELINQLHSIFKSKRFLKENVGTLLQHYGLRTIWLDLVDNLFIAIWFSNYNATNENTYTFVKFFSTNYNNSELIINDLRYLHSSLSLRPHCQHGISVLKKVKIWDTDNCDYSTNLIAIAKIPNNDLFKLHGYFFSKKFMFPDEVFDNTFKLLSKNKFKFLIEAVTQKHNLSLNDLGFVN
jgi:FRG domain